MNAKAAVTALEDLLTNHAKSYKLANQTVEYTTLTSVLEVIADFKDTLDVPQETGAMTVVPVERVVPVDIDGTLVVHGEYHLLKNWTEDYIQVDDPYAECPVILKINQPMVRLFQEEIARGAHMLVWSRGGYRWAETIIKALDLDSEHVTIMSKPYHYFDDIEIKDWLTQRVFLPHDANYK